VRFTFTIAEGGSKMLISIDALTGIGWAVAGADAAQGKIVENTMSLSAVCSGVSF
jgi:hypothetical protein